MDHLSRRASLPTGNGGQIRDRKSTRLNSSHLVISYAVFCLKKKKNTCIDDKWGTPLRLPGVASLPTHLVVDPDDNSERSREVLSVQQGAIASVAHKQWVR